MDIFDHDVLGADEEIALARALEAGVLARAVLDGEMGLDAEATTDELWALVEQGERAWEQLWMCNLKLVRSIAWEVVRGEGELVDEAFQDGCLGLAEAIMVWDHRVGTRFSTIAWGRIRNAMQTNLHVYGPDRLRRHGRRERAKVLKVAAELVAAGESVTFDRLSEVTRRSGKDLQRLVGPVEVAWGEDMAWVGATDPIEEGWQRCPAMPPWFDSLPPIERRVLELRFGLTGPELSSREAAAAVGLSYTTLRRVERRAMAHLKEVLHPQQASAA